MTKYFRSRRIESRHASWVALAVTLIGGTSFGCGDDSSSATAASSATAEGTEGTQTTEGAQTTTDTATSEGTTEDSSTTLEESTGSAATGSSSDVDETCAGADCGDPMACDRGELVGSIVVDETTTDVSEFMGYTSVTGWVEISRSGLEELSFLSCLETVGHDVTIFDNDVLVDVRGLDRLTEIGVATKDLPLAGPGVECPCRDGTFVFSENDGIVDFNGANALQQTPLSLNIGQNTSLTTISGLGSFVGTGRDFVMRFNPVLEDVSAGGLQDMQFISGECVVSNNTNLCISDIEAMCGDLMLGPSGGNTANNNMSC